jgi:glycerophosphoryl diester phosphodiesterase
MNRRSFLILAGLVLLSLAFLLVFTPDAPSRQYYVNIRHPLVIAHQGGDGIWPGDTLYAFENAVEIGADVLDMDAHITKDDQIVLMHDEKIDSTTEGTGLIEDLTLAQLKKLDAAYQWSNDDRKTFPYRGRGIEGHRSSRHLTFYSIQTVLSSNESLGGYSAINSGSPI